MSHVNRYRCTVGDKRGEFGDCMEKDPQGQWVRASAHKNTVSQLRQRIAKLEKQLARGF